MKAFIDDVSKWAAILGIPFAIGKDAIEFDKATVFCLHHTNATDFHTLHELGKVSLSSEHRLIGFFANEWFERGSQCREYIKSVLGLNQRRFYARKCRVSRISKPLAKKFLEDNHLQGSNRLGLAYFGLFHQDELVGVLSLGRHHRQNTTKMTHQVVVLDRLFKAGVRVVGGAGKLFAEAIDWAKKRKYGEVISFSDNRWSQGEVYKALDFSLQRQYRPDYSYIVLEDTTQRLSKQSQKKRSVRCPVGMTEFQWAKERGLLRVWDFGKCRWGYKLDPSIDTWNDKISQNCARQHSDGVFLHSHRRGYIETRFGPIYYGSSYEMRCIYLLTTDPEVVSLRRADFFRTTSGSGRAPDLLVEYADGSKTLIEVKPEDRSVVAADQIKDSQEFAAREGIAFKLWTEADSGLKDEKAIIAWHDRYIEAHAGDPCFLLLRRKKNVEKSRRYYQKHLQNDKVQVRCEFCKEDHVVLKITYDRNVSKNGRFICIKENGHLIGKRSKDHLKKENIYAAEGMKKCLGPCSQVLDLTEFGNDKSRSDGKASRCKKCRASHAKEKYNAR